MVADTARTWAIEMLQLVATERPDLPTEERLLQLESLVRFRTIYFDRIKPSFDENWKRGILFESLVLSDPRFPERSEIEQQVSRYLLCALANDVFLLTAAGRLHYPDDIVVKVEDSVATVTALVEIKLNPGKQKDKILTQLGAHINNLLMLDDTINQYLSAHKQLPTCYESAWPDSITSLVLPEGYDRVLFKPDNSGFVPIEGWQVLPALFTRGEVRVVSDFLWHVDLGKEATPRD